MLFIYNPAPWPPSLPAQLPVGFCSSLKESLTPFGFLRFIQGVGRRCLRLVAVCLLCRFCWGRPVSAYVEA